MIAPSSLSNFSATELLVLERARDLDRARRDIGLETVTGTLEVQDPPGCGMRLAVEISVTPRLTSMRILHQRLQVATEDLDKDFATVVDGAVLPRRVNDHEEDGAATAAAGPISEAGREHHAHDSRGEGRTT